MKVCLFCGRVEDKNSPHKTNLKEVGLNTGNMLFWYALSSILQAEQTTVAECMWKKVDTTQYDSFITTDMIWIQENATFPVVKQQLQIANDRPLVPISVGLQSRQRKKDFQMHEETLHLLSEIQERCVIGTRGEYTAEILSQYGIRNIQVIGCPSMYLPFDYRFQIRKNDMAPQYAAVNMRSMYSELSPEEISFLVYAANHDFGFCEQTSDPFSQKICKDPATYEYLNTWLNTNKMIFFDVADWRDYISKMDFSMGCRFHGNVVALWEHVPSLFITIDSRTEELCQHFSLPTMSIRDFDPEKDIRYYYDLADYSAFNRSYADRLDEFISFLKKNHLPIRPRIDEYYDRKIIRLEGQIQRLLNGVNQ